MKGKEVQQKETKGTKMRGEYYPLFEHMAREHALYLLESELDEICRIVLNTPPEQLDGKFLVVLRFETDADRKEFLDPKNQNEKKGMKMQTDTEPQSEMTQRDYKVIKDKELRRDIDAQIQRVKDLNPSRERSLAITKLQEAVMWLGMDLKRLNEPNPYPNSKDPSNAKVEPTADGLKL